MLWSAGVLIVAGIIAWFELPALLKQQQKKDLWAFCMLLAIAVGISIPVLLIRHFPSPLLVLTVVFKPFIDFLSAVGLIP
ncbi:hypothetical protein HMSSN036_91850 [Paenibacillus macerans]|uniref:hypothetical protein n=1 Tax=Paenibacillus sp. FSL R5-0527 TaxID=2975321 RepID=UPI000979E9B0|nr:hypothetical protein BK140_08880 [Paenibacillus macerans]GJM76969.1 hypothetical protein HMSSN036_91850 [Paenibacillus macerans]